MNTVYLAKLYEDLKNEITPSAKAFIEIQQKEYSKEIERLNKELEEKEAILGGIQQLEAEIERLNNIINTIQQEMKNLYDTGILSIKPYYVWERIEILKGADKE